MKKNDGFAMQIKPVGSSCNIRCKYCYVEPFRGNNQGLMSEKVLENAIKKCIESSSDPMFSWHGGEPTLAGLEFFEKAVEYIKKYSPLGQQTCNMIQTNATLIDEKFAKFFKENEFVVSVSLDGPKHVHNIHRISGDGKGTFDSVLKGIENLLNAGIRPNVMSTVTKETLKYSEETFDFLVEKDFKLIKYSPCYDSLRDNFSISNEEWFEYLKKVFWKWFEIGDPDIQVRELDEVISWINNSSISVCSSDNSCARWVSIDPLGNLYPCEYLRSQYQYGNIADTDFSKLAKSAKYQSFLNILLTPQEECKKCEYYRFCGNGCPSTRIAKGKISYTGKYVFCRERKMLYQEISKAFDQVLTHERR